MKRLSLTALILIVLSTGASAQYESGSIGIYTDQTASDCDLTFTPYVPVDLTIMYYRSTGGPDGITAAEFRLDFPAGLIIVSSFTKSPEVSITLGAIDTGIACSFVGCTGTGENYVVIGTVNVLATSTSPVVLKILESTELTRPPYTPLVTMCDDQRTFHSVLGGWFTAPDGTCDVGTEEASWGAIKDMYKD